MSRLASRTLRAALVGALLGALCAGTLTAAPTQAATNVVTPGDFTGYGFDQCLTPSQKAMDTWLSYSPFLSAGVYISGDSRACRSQPNLTAGWVRTQLSKGWRLLPITLGPQASCQPRFPRYSDDFTISPKPGKYGGYGRARNMGTAEATKTVKAAQALGITARSTLWYDLEGFDDTNTACRESALAFLSAWTERLHKLNYVSGVYSSAGSGMASLDRARINRQKAITMPDQIWVARWDGVANTSTSYLREDGWRPHARVKQYQGGHDETWGGVRINIDRNFLDVGRGSVAPAEPHCGGVRVDWATYDRIRPPSGGRVSDAAQVKTLQCLLKEKGRYSGPVNGRFNPTLAASIRSWRVATGFGSSDVWLKRNWVSLLSTGARPVLKYGSAGGDVRRLQRALNAAYAPAVVPVTGVAGSTTISVLRSWQQARGLQVTGVAAAQTWATLQAPKG